MEDSVVADSVVVAADASPPLSPAVAAAGAADDGASSPELVIENDDSMVSSTATPSADKLLGIEDDDPDAVAASDSELVVLEPVSDVAAGDGVAAESASGVDTVVMLGSSTR